MSPLEHGLLVGWPFALTLAAILLRDRIREGRRRGALNRALHELRRPLQTLALGADAVPGNGRRGTDRVIAANGVEPNGLELAVAALDDLDRELNGSEPPPRLRPLECRRCVESALGRWRVAAGRAGSKIELRWHARHATVLADSRRLAQALDNLIVNALEHGSPPIRVEGSVAGSRVRITVLDGGGPVSPAPPNGGVGGAAGRLQGWLRRRRTAGRRGHGLEVVTRIAREHGGRLEMRSAGRGTAVMLDLPLADLSAEGILGAAA